MFSICYTWLIFIQNIFKRIRVFSFSPTFWTSRRILVQSDRYRSKVVTVLSARLVYLMPMTGDRPLATSLPLTRCGGFPVLFSITIRFHLHPSYVDLRHFCYSSRLNRVYSQKDFFWKISNILVSKDLPNAQRRRQEIGRGFRLLFSHYFDIIGLTFRERGK